MLILTVSRLSMKYTLFVAVYLTLIRARFTSSSNNFLNDLDKTSWLENESDSKMKESVSAVHRKILVRKAREAVPSGHHDIDKDIEKLTTDAINISENIKRENVPASGGTFVRPSSNSKSAMFDNEIKKIKEEIEEIKSLLPVSDSLRVKLNSFEEAMIKVKKDFDDKNREFSGKLENTESLMNLLTGTVVNISRELNQVKTQISQSERLASENALPAAIIEEVKSRNFDSAYQKMSSLKDQNKINYIVHEIYNNNDGNFELILQFGDSIKFVESSFRVYKALNYQMESNNHNDPFKLVKLIDSLEKQVINQLKSASALKEEATNLKEKVKSLLKNILVRKMKDASKDRNYQTLSALCDQIFLTQAMLFNEAVNQVTNENLGTVDPEDFFKYFAAHKYIGQIIYGLAALFNEMRRKARSDEKVMISIAFKLKHLMQLSNYHLISSHEQSVAAKMKENMATSLKNLVFASRVCIKNNDRAEYLYAAGDAYKADEARRTVLTWIKGTQVTQGDWIIERDGDIFYIKNYSHNEYLYAASDDYKYDVSRRNVYTWIPGDRVSQGRWVFELSGPNVYIKNYQLGGYLFADQNLKLDSGRRHVFNWFYSSKPDLNYEWKILDCS